MFVHYADGTARSKLTVDDVERQLGVVATARKLEHGHRHGREGGGHRLTHGCPKWCSSRRGTPTAPERSSTPPGPLGARSRWSLMRRSPFRVPPWWWISTTRGPRRRSRPTWAPDRMPSSVPTALLWSWRHTWPSTSAFREARWRPFGWPWTSGCSERRPIAPECASPSGPRLWLTPSGRTSVVEQPVVKPTNRQAGQGVIRADTAEAGREALARVRGPDRAARTRSRRAVRAGAGGGGGCSDRRW